MIDKRIVGWQIQRVLQDRLRVLLPFSSDSAKRRVLMISAYGDLPNTQLFPFFYHRAELASRYSLELREVPLERWQSGNHPYRQRVDAVCLQTGYVDSPAALQAIVTQIRETYPGCRLAYFDWFAPTDLRYAAIVNDDIDLYLKKHLLKERDQYGQATLGDTNLTDFYSRRFALDEVTVNYPVPDSFWPKVAMGSNFAFAAHIMPRFLGHFPATARTLDVHARIATKGTPWYSQMRQEAYDAVQALPKSISTASLGMVPGSQYRKELLASRLCFSPFGYGEVCWRDFEAMYSGSLLLKPDMSHLDCSPQIYVPYETYVPLAWDLSDFAEKVDYYLAHPQQREAIAQNAFAFIKAYFSQQQFLSDMHPVISKLLGE